MLLNIGGFLEYLLGEILRDSFAILSDEDWLFCERNRLRLENS